MHNENSFCGDSLIVRVFGDFEGKNISLIGEFRKVTSKPSLELKDSLSQGTFINHALVATFVRHEDKYTLFAFNPPRKWVYRARSKKSLQLHTFTMFFMVDGRTVGVASTKSFQVVASKYVNSQGHDHLRKEQLADERKLSSSKRKHNGREAMKIEETTLLLTNSGDKKVKNGAHATRNSFPAVPVSTIPLNCEETSRKTKLHRTPSPDVLACMTPVDRIGVFANGAQVANLAFPKMTTPQLLNGSASPFSNGLPNLSSVTMSSSSYLGGISYIHVSPILDPMEYYGQQPALRERGTTGLYFSPL